MAEPEEPAQRTAGAADLPLFPEEEPASEAGAAPAEPAPEEGSLEEAVPLGARVLAGLADLAVHAGVLVVAVLGQSFLGLAPSLEQAPAYGVFLLAFSFLYCVVPMAFWGQTPGMASLGLVVRTAEGENLSFPQTSLRWFAAMVTFLLLGLPFLLALTGRSLGDRWSRSGTYRFAS